MDFSSIKYIFQIPLDWFKSVNDRCFKSYGGNLIRLNDGQYGGVEIGVDPTEFEDAVKRIAGSGSVSSVDNVSPDETGNVPLNALRADESANGVVYNGYGTVSYKSVGNGAGYDIASGDHTHSGYAASDHTHSGYAALDHTHSGYAALDHTHSGYAASNHSHSLSDINGSVPGHSGNCLLTVNGSTIGHSGNDWYNALSEITAGTLRLTGGNKTVYFRNSANSNPNAWVSDISGNYLEFYHAVGGQLLKWDGANLALGDANICKLYQYSGGIALYGASNITLYSASDGVKLLNHPSSPDYSAASFSVPSVGWTELYFAGFDSRTYSQLADQNITLVTDVVWNGTSLVKKTVTLSTHKGIMTTSSSMQPVETVIDTPTVVSWS